MKTRFLYFLPLAMLLTGVALAIISLRPHSAQVIASEIAENVRNELKKVDKDFERVSAAYMATGRLPLEGLHYSFYLYKQGTVVQWTDNDFVPTGRQLRDTFDVKLLNSSGSEFLVRKWSLGPESFIVGMIPLTRTFPITNEYLQSEWNEFVFSNGRVTVREPDVTEGTPVCLENSCLFRVVYEADQLPQHPTLRALAVGCVFAGLGLGIVLLLSRLNLHGRVNPLFIFLALYAFLWLLRFTMTSLDFPGMLTRVSLFDPQIYASSNLNRSLGDLLLNLICLVIVTYYLFRNYHHIYKVKWIHSVKLIRHVTGVASALIFFLSFSFPFLVIQNIFNNSAISLDIAGSVSFDSLRIISYLVVIFSWLAAFFFGHVFLKVLFSEQNKMMLLLQVTGGAALFMLINEMNAQPYGWVLLVSLLFAGVVYFLRLHKSMQQVTYTTFSYIFTVITCLSIISTIAVTRSSKQERIENQFRFASTFLVDRDIFGEYLLREVSEKVSSDLFIQSRMVSPFLSKDAIRLKIRQYLLPNYFNKYDVEILLFGAAGTPLSNRSPITFSSLLSTYNKEAFRTEYEGIYFVNDPESDIAHRYLMVIPIDKAGMVQGYVVLELLLKKVIPENVYPELLIDSRFQQFYRMNDMSYAVYGRDLLYSAGEYNYERNFKREMLGNPAIHLEGLENKGFVHVAEEDENNRVSVVSTPVLPFRYLMANFSFLLVIGLALLLLFILIQGVVNFAQGRTMSFSTRIQILLNLAFFLPLIIVSVTTLQFTSISSREQLSEEYLSKSRSFGSQVSSIMDDYELDDPSSRTAFENQLSDMAKLYNVDANVFSPEGSLIASSQPFIFESGLISDYLNPSAHQAIKDGQNLFITTSHVGSLQFNICYATLRSSRKADLIGVLALPFFQSVHSLDKIRIGILANILNIFAGIFIVLIVVSYLVSEWLTFPLKFITRSLSRTSLVQTNEPLRWKADDEIGLMVKEYNQMLYKLSESKAELEQTQRERAWREIAQQVAHEIKNPLTPMKLTLQQLQRALESGSGDAQDKTQKAVSSMLSQVETLNEIASSFSSFAKMPEPAIERLELIQLLRRTIDLHSQDDFIHFKPESNEVYIDGDAQLLGRIFSNLMINAIQSARPGVALRVDILTERKNRNIRITVRDNGKGIEKRIADRVFLPHFSTKHTGSGLGLAISKQGIEHMRGKIWFETAPNEGTIFFIELPLSQDQ